VPYLIFSGVGSHFPASCSSVAQIKFQDLLVF
jgi:hypothetical protein